jgi:hypothetical protein
MRDEGHQYCLKSPLAGSPNPVFGPGGTAPTNATAVTKKSDELLQLNQTTEFAPGLEGKRIQCWLMCLGGLGIQVRRLRDKGAAKAARVGPCQPFARWEILVPFWCNWSRAG